MGRRVGWVVALAAAAVLAAVLVRGAGATPIFTTDPATQAWLDQHRDQADLAVEKARTWLEPLRPDPVELRAHGIKGKKKVVELLGAWYRLYRVADDSDRPTIRAHLEEIDALTRDPAWHDLGTTGDAEFKEDATSYLRAAYLLDRLGFDETGYRDQMLRIQPRLDAHLDTRGPSQRLAFDTYYRAFGLKEPFPLAAALADGVIAHRTPAATLDLEDVYGLTHEVFSSYDYGDALDAHPFAPDDLRYLRRALPELIDRFQDNVDVVAELVSCLRYVRAIDLAAYRHGLDLVLARQAEDGHWGDYSAQTARNGAWDTTWHYELHTTAVGIDALTIAFHPDWNRGVKPDVP